MTPLHFADHPVHLQAVLQAALSKPIRKRPFTSTCIKRVPTCTSAPTRLNWGTARLFYSSAWAKQLYRWPWQRWMWWKRAVSGGGIIAKHLPEGSLPLPAYAGSHPVPGEPSVAATRSFWSLWPPLPKMIWCFALSPAARRRCLPGPRVPLDDWQALNQALLASGCPIQAINTVRRHLDAVKGGGLARWAALARVISLLLSDVVGNDLAAIGSGPTVANQESRPKRWQFCSSTRWIGF